MDNDEIWKSIKGELEIVANPAHYKAHIPGSYIKTIDTESKIIEITCPSEYQKNFIEDRMYGNLITITKKIVGPEYKLMFSVTKKDPSAFTEEDFGPLFGGNNHDNNGNSENIAVEAGLNPQYTFKRFIVGNNNRLAYAVSTAITDNPGKIYNPFFLYSGVGLGKTHLVQAIGHEIITKHPNLKILYKNGEQFLNEVVDAVMKGKNQNNLKRNAFKNKYRNVDVLIVDDIHAIAGKDTTQEEFFHTFNTLFMAQKQIILTSDRPPSEIRTLEERLSSRFSSGMIADIQPPDYETRVAILRERNAELQLGASDEVIQYIASAVNSNIRELEAKLLQTVTRARSMGQLLNIETTRSIVGEIDANRNKLVTPNLVMREVTKYYGTTIKDLKGQRRMKTIVIPRQVAMYLLRDLNGLGFQAIGELLGGRDHTTVMHGVEKIEIALQQNTRIIKEIEQIKSNIFNSK